MENYDKVDRDSVLSSQSIDQRIHPTLLNLPLETRQDIYDYVFHSVGCNETGGCHCGDNLSIVNRQLYQEARPLVYKYAKPRLLDVESCLRFLRDIKDNVVYIKYLSIIDRELSSQSYRLADVFRHKGIEGLEVFHFIVKPRVDSSRWSRRSRPTQYHFPPIYSLFEERNTPAAVYDMYLRVSRHPLAAMKSLRSLTVEGYPPSDIEEAIFKASRNIEDLGRREGKTVKRWERENKDTDPYGSDSWFYGIAIVD